ncbi:ChrR family anti-sigma-E factor [Gallaecimonas kandeliae]|uniref:ChrR family anti-sigma-E factor n=1 Tax=Gallaecimonas kandeliae TaxID=3029055 RepID=UPI002647A0D5|nr:ChrR family anti-sigma-E factor [Gallaecimonas kandeliae]WKE64009.1 ChrR family anti-sigma-E factor [Gallaecimonas kandeliae]
MKTKHHPDIALLAGHARGELPAAISAALAAHLEQCTRCRDNLAEAEAEAGQAFLEESQTVDQGLLEAMLARLDEPAPPAPPAPQTRLSVNGDSFELPRALAGLQGRLGSWRRLGSKVWSADLDLGDRGAKASFLYIDSHTRIPRHRHGGQELTVVLAGHLKDEGGLYREGDFIRKGPTDEHQPFTEEAPCLCFSVLTAPLVFTGPLGRLANPLLRLLF